MGNLTSSPTVSSLYPPRDGDSVPRRSSPCWTSSSCFLPSRYLAILLFFAVGVLLCLYFWLYCADVWPLWYAVSTLRRPATQLLSNFQLCRAVVDRGHRPKERQTKFGRKLVERGRRPKERQTSLVESSLNEGTVPKNGYSDRYSVCSCAGSCGGRTSELHSAITSLETTCRNWQRLKCL